MDLVHRIYGPWWRRVALRLIAGRVRDPDAPERGRFTERDVDEIVAEAWAAYDRGARKLPKLPTIGSAMNARLACFTLSLFEALLARGASRRHAIALVADGSWAIYRTLARVRSRLSPHATLSFATTDRKTGEPLLLFPFNAPGYRVALVTAGRGAAFDVAHCPVAEYFRLHDASDLCLAAWCDLDYSLAEETGETMVRTKTIAGGAYRCDFRVFRPDGKGRTTQPAR